MDGSIRTRFFLQDNPDSSTDTGWLPHNAFTVKGSALTKSPVSTKPENGGNFSSTEANFVFTLVTGNIYKCNIANLANVYECNIGSQSLTGRYIHAPRINETLDYIQCLFYVNSFGVKYTVEADETRIATTLGSGEVAGDVYIVLPGGYSSTVRVMHSVFSGAVAKNQRVEGFPFVRALQAGELVCQMSALGDLHDAFVDMNALTVSSLYDSMIASLGASYAAALRPTNATEQQIVRIFQPETDSIGASNPYVGIGQGQYVYGSPSFTVERTGEGAFPGMYKITILGYSASSYTEYRLRNSANYTDWDAFTQLKFRLFCTVNATIYIYLSTLPTHLAGFNESYFASIKVAANTWEERTLRFADFVSLFDYENDGVVWFPGKRLVPVTSYGSGTFTASYQLLNVSELITVPELRSPISRQPLVLEMTMTKALVGSGVGYTFENSPDELALAFTMPGIYFRKVSGEFYFVILDANGNFFYYLDDSVTGQWTYREFDRESLFPFNPGDVFNDSAPVQQISIQVANAPATSAVVQVYYIGNEPSKLPINCKVYDISLGIREQSLHAVYLDYVEVSNIAPDNLRYTPGVTSDFVKLRDNEHKYYAACSVGSQNLYLAEKTGRKTEAANILNFYREAREDGKRKSGLFQINGLFTPVLHWENYLLHAETPHVFEERVRVFPTWLYWDGNIQYRAIYDIAKALKLNPKNLQYKELVEDSLEFLNFYFYTVSGSSGGNAPIYIKNSAGLPQIASTFNVEGSALLMMAAINANLAGADRFLSMVIIVRMFTFLESRYETTGAMAGTWTKGRANINIEGINYRHNSAREHGLVMQAYSMLYKERVNFRYPSKAEWDF